MLVLTLKKNERVFIGEDICVEYSERQGDKVRVGFMAPRDVEIMREEICSYNDRRVLRHKRPEKKEKGDK